MGGVKTTPFDRSRTEADECSGDSAVSRGVELAVELARGGRLISAIKCIEANNPDLTREEAKAIVQKFGYGPEVRWPEPEKLPLRRL